MLLGEFKHTIDAKGRVIMPARFRDDIGTNFCVTVSTDGCLRAYSMENWLALDARLQALPDSDPKAVGYKRHIYSHTIECEFDKQGRALLNEKLRSYAGLEKDVVVVGMSGYVEIWNPERWENRDNVEGVDISQLSAYGL